MPNRNLGRRREDLKSFMMLCYKTVHHVQKGGGKKTIIGGYNFKR